MPKSHEDERDGRCPPEEVMDVEEVDGFEDPQTDEEVCDVGCKDIEGAEPEDVCPVITQRKEDCHTGRKHTNGTGIDRVDQSIHCDE